jgi:hypothetical protein
VLRNFIALKNPSAQPGMNPYPFGPVARTQTTTPPRRLNLEVEIKHQKNGTENRETTPFTG